MQTVVFYLLPIKEYRNINYDSAKELKELISKIESISDTFLIPYCFFEPDSGGETIYDKEQNSALKLLAQIIGKCSIVDTEIGSINTEDYHNCFIRIDKLDLGEEEAAIHSKEELLKYYQDSAYELETFSDLFDWKNRCFPNLLFTEDSFGNNHMAFHNASEPDYANLLSQTLQCLTVLNNDRIVYHAKEISEALPSMQAVLSGISCTGKGGNETQKYKKKVLAVKIDSQTEHTIPCHPHFKLIRGDSDYRIYFSWGNEDIKENTFIVVKVGSHWIDSNDSSLSKIIIDT